MTTPTWLRHLRRVGLITLILITLSGLTMGTIMAITVDTVLRWFGV